ncbi:MAG TPA: acyltransferase, partial [Rhodobacteraceae bacterium]|nr:acyltransferase [Paracoccaceae bacterium]
MNTSGRMNWVDMAKGISILLVVMMYAIYSTGRATGETGFMHYVIGFATPFRMPEFFLLSGLFLGNVIARDWRRFLDRRVVHYLYFYAVWASILIIVKVALFAGDPGRALAMLA